MIRVKIATATQEWSCVCVCVRACVRACVCVCVMLQVLSAHLLFQFFMVISEQVEELLTRVGLKGDLHTHTHTHTQREREREGERGIGAVTRKE